MWANADVDLWTGQSVVAAEPQKVTLEIAASSVAGHFVANRQAKYLRLTDCAAKLTFRNGSRLAAIGCQSAQIEDRSGWRRNRDTAAKRYSSR